jgi:hypothetical protein
MSQPLASPRLGKPQHELLSPLSPSVVDRSQAAVDAEALKGTHSSRPYATVGRKVEKKREGLQNVFTPPSKVEPPVQLSLVRKNFRDGIRTFLL